MVPPAGIAAFPGHPDQVTPEWLSAALSLPGPGAVVSVRWERIGEDRGFWGLVVRLHLKYDHAGLGPPTLIAKFPAISAESAYLKQHPKDPAVVFERCRMEVEFYEQQAGSLSVPKMIFGAACENPVRAVLVFEDLGHLDPGDALGLCSPEEAAVVVGQIARLHGQTWNRVRDDLPPKWIRPPHKAAEQYRTQLPSFLNRYEHRIPDRVIQRLRQLDPAAVQEFINTLPVCCVHGDLHLDNVLFNHEGSGGISAVILDWQTYGAGSGPLEVAQFLVASLSAPDLRSAKDSLWQQYAAALEDKGVLLSQDVSRRVFRAGVLRRTWVIVVWMGSADPEVYQGREKSFLTQALDDPSLFECFMDLGSVEA